jgi:hypothetical protein
MRRSALFTFTIVFVSALALYVSSAAPSLTWAHAGADGGDLITAAVTNGVPHPPGYPTYITLGQLIARVPIGDVAYRFNLLSAVCMALAAGFTALSLLQLIPTPTRFLSESVAIIASLFFVTAPMVWGQATIAEVHALNACFVALIVYLISPIVFRGDDVSLRHLVLAAWLWGIAFGNSLTVAALSPLMIIAWWRGRVSGSPYKSVLPIATFFIGLSVYALIPLRAAQQPPINWGDAASLDRFLALITAEMYRGYALSTPPADLLSRVVAFAQLIVTQYGWLGVILGAIGIYYALVSLNKNWRWMFGAWAIARGLFALTRYWPRFSRYLLLIIFLLGPGLNLLVNLPAMNLRADHTATDFINEVSATAPPQAMVITANDGQTFALWYHRHVAGQRSDLTIVDARLAGYPWYAAMLNVQGSAPALPEYDPSSTWVDRLAKLNPKRAVCIIDPDSARMACRP